MSGMIRMVEEPIPEKGLTASPCGELTGPIAETAFDTLESNIDTAARNYGWPHGVYNKCQ